MKTKLLYSALIASCLVALSSCDPNDWNDKLDGDILGTALRSDRK